LGKGRVGTREGREDMGNGKGISKQLGLQLSAGSEEVTRLLSR